MRRRKTATQQVRDFGFLFFTFCLTLALFNQPGKVYAEPVSISIAGMSPIIGGNMVNARNNAIQDGLRNAVEQATGTIIDSQTLTENNEFISDQVYTKSNGFIESYKVESEGKNSFGAYEVQLSAQVNTGKLTESLDAIGMLPRLMGNPRIMVIFKEKNMSDAFQDGFDDFTISENILMEEFLKKSDEFNFVDRTQANANLDRAVAQAAIEGDDKAASSIGLFYNADYIITGKSVSRSKSIKSFGAEFISAQAMSTARIIRVSTSQVIGTATARGKHAPVFEEITGGTEAIKAASVTLSKDIMEKILQNWRTESSGSRKMIVLLKNSSFKDANQFVSFLTNYVTGIKDAKKSEFRDGVARYQIESRTSTEQVAEEIDGKTLGTKVLAITALTDGKIEVSLRDQ